ncbi:Protein of unknown function [Escherichia coli D6-117.29]|nr:Protein of unknown function [Escherichia coli]CDP78270.1 Protein of unknown function [Escherichia coli D6-117.29]CDU41442.1 Protein of unknown function [Escherichia coli]
MIHDAYDEEKST